MASTHDNINGKLYEAIVAELQTVFDPEIPVNIYDLGLIYDIEIGEDRVVDIRMTFTSPSCPVADMLFNDVYFKVRDVEGVEDVRVAVTWDPPWSKDMATEKGKMELEQLFGI